jgi:hypothetical protein
MEVSGQVNLVVTEAVDAVHGATIEQHEPCLTHTMNHTLRAVSAAAIVTSALAMPAAFAQAKKASAQPIIPVGALQATPSVVQTGTYPTLNWSIVYPSKVGDVAVITPPGSLTLTEQLYVSVRAIGVGVTGTNGSTTSSTPAEFRIQVGGGGYDQLFYGNSSDIDPSHTLYTKKLNSGTTIDFGGRFVKDGEWTPFYTTRSGNVQVVSLVDGDAIPTSYDLNQSGKMAEYLKPYVDSTGKVNIGPLSVLVMAEYATSDHSKASFDYQDAVFLVSLSPKNNNGHGNNIDGVDVSNPGKGSGGPNGAVDPSGGVDDEAR